MKKYAWNKESSNKSISALVLRAIYLTKSVSLALQALQLHHGIPNKSTLYRQFHPRIAITPPSPSSSDAVETYFYMDLLGVLPNLILELELRNLASLDFFFGTHICIQKKLSSFFKGLSSREILVSLSLLSTSVCDSTIFLLEGVLIDGLLKILLRFVDKGLPFRSASWACNI